MYVNDDDGDGDGDGDGDDNYDCDEDDEGGNDKRKLDTKTPSSRTLQVFGCSFFCSSRMRDRARICWPSGTDMICWLTRA